jgi:hypothetical protein
MGERANSEVNGLLDLKGSTGTRNKNARVRYQARRVHVKAFPVALVLTLVVLVLP